MTQSVAILGRQPALGLAELESLYGPTALTPIGDEAAVIDKAPANIDLKRLGGTQKIAMLLKELPYTDWPRIITYVTDKIPEYLPYIPEGKIRLGLSLHGMNVQLADINRAGLKFKKIIREQGRSVRVVPNKTPALSTAQTIHNQLTGATGLELVIIRSGNKTVIGQVASVQDIAAYGARDQARPKRDARVGMLPPKLAQIIINLVVGQHESPVASRQSPALETRDQGLETTRIIVVLDPFCGTGVILQEALLMGYDVCGTDLEPRMVEYSEVNLQWLRQNHPELPGLVSIHAGDATSYDWPEGISAIAAETYLGRPFSSLPGPSVLEEVMRDVDTIHRKFLKNLSRQTATGFRMCIAVPAWKTPRGFQHLKVLDSLEELGYTRAVFTHVDNKDLVYHRPEQIVARELVVLTRK